MESCSPGAQEINNFFQYTNAIKHEMQSNKSEEKKQKLLTKVRKRLLTFIDTEYVAKKSLGKYFNTLSDNDKNEFILIFHEIMAHNLVKTYIPINNVVDQDVNVEFINEEFKKDEMFNENANIIHMRVIDESIIYYVDFYLHSVEGKFKLYDVHIDGASVLMDYQNQFYGIISTKGFPYLLKRLKEKYEKLEAASS
ncbi:MAG: ABC transporter substrate-binding protein [Spirochaetia bacterium]|nr:ABC transporter substrate-binding protein [Spirochaetia bacterium]